MPRCQKAGYGSVNNLKKSGSSHRCCDRQCACYRL